MSETDLSYSQSGVRNKPDTPRFLITLDVGIGDAVAVGLRAIEQMIENDPSATGMIDILCNTLQAQVFAEDPRINRIIETSRVFFPGVLPSQWLRGMVLNSEARHVIRFLRQRHYEAVFPSIVAPGLYFRLHSRIMYPHLLEMAQNFLLKQRRVTLHESTIVRQMVNRYFGKTTLPLLDKSVFLYLSSSHIQKAMKTIELVKNAVSSETEARKVIIVAPDTASAVTRPPIDLLIASLSSVLLAQQEFLIYILPSYTETTRSRQLREALEKDYAQRVFLMASQPKAHLLEIAALMDLADVVITGDTGIMHLAATKKLLRADDERCFSPRNAGKVIALFGGTSPSYFGYSKDTTIVGWGRKEQMDLRPGFFKESYNLRGRNIFDHISSQQVVDAILG